MKLKYFLILLFFITGLSHTASAQGVDELGPGSGYLEDDGTSLWDEGGFMDDTGIRETEGQYLEEEEVRAQEAAIIKAVEEDPSINIARALEQDRALLDKNIIYGIGTGVTIGGWLALLYGQDARQNVQYVSLGIISGVLLGVLIGTKSLYQTPAAYNLTPIQPYQPASPLFKKSENTLARLDFSIPF